MKKFKKLRVRLAELDLQQKDLALALGVSDGTITSRLQGRTPWTAWEISKLAPVLGLKLDEIGEYFCGKGC